MLRTSREPIPSLYIAGRDGGGDPLDRDTSAGTLFGVYEWLQRDLGVRWLWPGELGTFVPRTESVAAREVDDTVAPALVQRHVRHGLEFTSEHPALGFTSKAAADYARAAGPRREPSRSARNRSYGFVPVNANDNVGAAVCQFEQKAISAEGATQ